MTTKGVFDTTGIPSGWFDLHMQAAAWFDDELVDSAAAGSITGTLAATEAQDVAAIIGQLRYSGTLTTVEAQDTAALTGTVAGSTITGTLAASETQDTASFAGTYTSATQSLHGRKIRRGRLLIFPEEEVVPVLEQIKAETRPVNVGNVAALAASVTEAKAALARLDGQRSKAVAKAEYDTAQTALAQAREAEIIQRLMEEDEIMLLLAA